MDAPLVLGNGLPVGNFYNHFELRLEVVNIDPATVYTLQGSDDLVTWDSVRSGINNTITLTTVPVGYRYYRLVCTNASGGGSTLIRLSARESARNFRTYKQPVDAPLINGQVGNPIKFLARDASIETFLFVRAIDPATRYEVQGSLDGVTWETAFIDYVITTPHITGVGVYNVTISYPYLRLKCVASSGGLPTDIVYTSTKRGIMSTSKHIVMDAPIIASNGAPVAFCKSDFDRVIWFRQIDAATRYSIQGSNEGVAWEDIQTGVDGTAELYFIYAHYQYYRLVCTTPSGGGVTDARYNARVGA
jgi:hypothetical protein